MHSQSYPQADQLNYPTSISGLASTTSLSKCSQLDSQIADLTDLSIVLSDKISGFENRLSGVLRPVPPSVACMGTPNASPNLVPKAEALASVGYSLNRSINILNDIFERLEV